MNRSLAELEGEVGSAPRMGALATLGGLVSQQPMLGALGALGPAFGLATNPITPHAVETARDLVTLPGRAMDRGITTEEAVPWAADTAMNLAGIGGPMATVGSLGAAGGKLATPQGIRAYHGSPHNFDRFDISKIGGGEGHQAYGHGLYFAENEATAKAYQEALGGKYTNPLRNQEMVTIAREMDKYAIPGAYRKFNDPRGYELAARYDRLMAEREKDVGHMYEVNLRAKPEQFLDWDKPLSEMGPSVQAALSGRASPHMTGAQINESSRIVPGKYRDNRIASEVLREAGIPGIKYLDQGSRVKDAALLEKVNRTIAETEALKLKYPQRADELERGVADLRRQAEAYKPTSNYVVFDDKIIDILKKYGVSSIAALPPAVQLMLGGQEQQAGGDN